MQVDRHRQGARECAASIGNFDGMHRGHAALIEQVRSLAARDGLISTVILLEPQPDELLRPQTAPPRLMRLTEKLRHLRAAGIDRVRCLRFNQAMAGMRAPDFIQRILREKIHVRTLVIGRDFRFGRGREGDLAMLRERGGFRVICIPDLQHAGQRISSSTIRTALARGRLDEARELLGRPYSLRGRVVAGAGRGRGLGFATANLHVRRPVLEGVYASRTWLDGASFPSVSYIGPRPVFGDTSPVLETHLLDFDGGRLYTRQIEVEFLHRLRTGGHFSDVGALQRQVALDVAAARQYHRPARQAHA